MGCSEFDISCCAALGFCVTCGSGFDIGRSIFDVTMASWKFKEMLLQVRQLMRPHF